MSRSANGLWLLTGLLLAGPALAGAGDEDLSCDQIGEQMAAIFGNGEFQTMLEDAEAANQAVNKTSKTAKARQQAEAPGLVARSMSETAMATNPVTATVGGLAANSAARAQGQAQMAQAKGDGAEGPARSANSASRPRASIPTRAATCRVCSGCSSCTKKRTADRRPAWRAATSTTKSSVRSTLSAGSGRQA
jgi:hypothetical protein